MLMQPVPASTSQSIARPFVVGTVMLLLFFSLQSDWGASRQQGGRRADLRQIGFAASPEAEQLPSLREKIIYELSVSNDKLERENWQLKQHILDMRRALRKEGCTLNGTAWTFPDLEKWLQSANDTGNLHFDPHRPKQMHVTSEESSRHQAEEKNEDRPTHERRQRLRASEASSAQKGPLRFAL